MENTEERFRAIYDRYMPLLRLIASRKSIPYDEIDDLVQETFTSFYTHYPVTWPEYKIRAALARIIRNLCTDYFRRQGTHPVIYVDSAILAVEGKSLGTPPEKNPLDIVLERQKRQEILDILKAMKNDWMIIFLLYLIQGRPMKEVSQILGISEPACRMRLMRGRQYINEQLSKKPEDRDTPFRQRPGPVSPGPTDEPEIQGNT